MLIKLSIFFWCHVPSILGWAGEVVNDICQLFMTALCNCPYPEGHFWIPTCYSNYIDEMVQLIQSFIIIHHVYFITMVTCDHQVLVYDKHGQDIISPLMNVKELRNSGVTLHLWVIIVQLHVSLTNYLIGNPMRL